jgi:hypothetical protein
MRVIITDAIATDQTSEPLQALASLCAFSARDWSTNREDAWLYGIVIGWGRAALLEVADLHGWDDATVARLRKLRAAYARAANRSARPATRAGSAR